MTYKKLSIHNIIHYVQETSELKDRFLNYSHIEVKEIGDGNLNYVYLIRENGRPEADLIIKQAVPYCRCLGEEYALNIERSHFEMRSLLHFSKLLPQHIPKIIKADEDMALIAMQYLGDHITARKALINAKHLPNLVEHITSFMAENLFKTSSFYLSSHDKRELIQQFNNNKDLCKITEDYVFTLPFTENKHERLTDSVKEKIISLKYKFMNHTEALLHGDMHTGSMMVNEKETYIFDSEFAVFGPIGFEVGMVLANFIFAWARQVVDGNDIYAANIRQSVFQIWNQFESKFLHHWQKKDGNALSAENFLTQNSLDMFKSKMMKQFLQDSIGFACCELLRRILGVAKVEDIETIEDKATYEQTKEAIIQIAITILLKYETMNSINDLSPFFTLNIKHLKVA